MCVTQNKIIRDKKELVYTPVLFYVLIQLSNATTIKKAPNIEIHAAGVTKTIILSSLSCAAILFNASLLYIPFIIHFAP